MHIHLLAPTVFAGRLSVIAQSLADTGATISAPLLDGGELSQWLIDAGDADAIMYFTPQFCDDNMDEVDAARSYAGFQIGYTYGDGKTLIVVGRQPTFAALAAMPHAVFVNTIDEAVKLATDPEPDQEQ